VTLQVQRGFHLVGYIRQAAEPLPSDIQQSGWAKPGTGTFEGVDFKRAIARTPTIIGRCFFNSQAYTHTFFSYILYFGFITL
jgi:hypothetical protein